MPLSQQQRDALNAPLSRSVVKGRKQGGRTVSYVEGWHVIAEANRIFGFDAWTSETVETRCVVERERLIGKELLPGWGVTYVAKVRVTVIAGTTVVFRDGYGAGHGIDVDIGLAHESAVKEAETDAFKRAIKSFGNPFGLALYDREQANVIDEVEASRLKFIATTKEKIAAFDEEDRDKILQWWHSDEQRKARRDFEITVDELDELKSLVSAKAKLPKRTNEQT